MRSCPAAFMNVARKARRAAVGIAAAIVIAACGSSSAGSSTSAGPGGRPPTQAQAQQTRRDVVRFAGCMRSHGVSGLPDPTIDPLAFKEAMGRLFGTPAYRSALGVCQHLLPRGGQATQRPAQRQARIAALLAFARCLRGHGFPSFPDPSSTGQISHQMLASAGIDVHQPALVQAADSCTSATHGTITRAMVAKFVAGQ